MQLSAEPRILQLRPRTYRRPGRLHIRSRSRPWDNRPANGTYRNDVSTPVDPAVARARFGNFVGRALDNARLAGLTDREIYRRSGVSTSTIHRWRLAEGKGLPRLPQVRAFCAAVDASIDEAMAALGMTDTAPTPTPEAPMPKEVRAILRKLADPNTPEADKQFIRMSLRVLAARLPSIAEVIQEEEAG